MVQNIMAGKGGAPPFGHAPFPLAVPETLLVGSMSDRTQPAEHGPRDQLMEKESSKERGKADGGDDGDSRERGDKVGVNGVRMEESDARTKALKEMRERNESIESEIREGVGQK